MRAGEWVLANVHERKDIVTKLNEMTVAQWSRRHDVIERHARPDGDDRHAQGAASERDGRTMGSEIKAIRMDVLKESASMARSASRCCSRSRTGSSRTFVRLAKRSTGKGYSARCSKRSNTSRVARLYHAGARCENSTRWSSGTSAIGLRPCGRGVRRRECVRASDASRQVGVRWGMAHAARAGRRCIACATALAPSPLHRRRLPGASHAAHRESGIARRALPSLAARQALQISTPRLCSIRQPLGALRIS